MPPTALFTTASSVTPSALHRTKHSHLYLLPYSAHLQSALVSMLGHVVSSFTCTASYTLPKTTRLMAITSPQALPNCTPCIWIRSDRPRKSAPGTSDVCSVKWACRLQTMPLFFPIQQRV